MKLSAYTAPRGNLLILGTPGTGKTTLLSMLTQSGYILECDGNIKGPANYLQRNKLISGCEFVIPHIVDELCDFDKSKGYKLGDVVKHGDRWDRMCALGTSAINDARYDMVAVDSLLTFNDYAMDKVRVENKKRVTTDTKPGEQISQPDWGTFYQLVKNFIIGFKAGSKDKLTVFTAHIGTDKDEMGGFLKYFAAIPGALKEQLAGLFDEVWKVTSEEKGGVQRHFIQTAPGLREEALGLKSSLGLGTKQEIDFTKLNQLFNTK